MTLRTKQTAAPPPNGDPLEFVMSDGTVDRMGDVIEPDGWKLDNFRANPVALFSHDAQFPIGKWADVAVRAGKMTGRLELMEPVSDRQREFRAAVDAGDVVIAEEAGVVEDVSADDITVRGRTGQIKIYNLLKFRRSNQGTCINQKPIVAAGDKATEPPTVDWDGLRDRLNVTLSEHGLPNLRKPSE